MIVGQNKPSLAELAHHGVKGMKWGHRKASALEIRTARSNLHDQKSDISAQAKKAKAATGTKNASAENKKLSDMKASFLANPDRVIAARMTRGEKFLTIIGGSIALPGAGLIPGTAIVLGTSARSRSIAKQQFQATHPNAKK